MLVWAQSTENPDPYPEQPLPSIADVGTELVNVFLNSDFLQNKLHRLYQLLDLKVRFIGLIKSLVTRDNLILLRSLLDYVVRVCNFVIGFLPEPVEETTKGNFLEVLFPVIGLNNPQNPVYSGQRVDRDISYATEDETLDDRNVQKMFQNSTFTDEERQLFEKHKEDVIEVAKLIYNTP